MMKIAILLSTYNGEKYIGSQLDSIFQQSNQQFTLYVRDDGSSDGTVKLVNEYCQKYNNIVLVKDDVKHRGASSSFMWLLQHVEADYYMFCDQDDVWLKNKLEVQLDALQNSENTEVPTVVFHDLVLTNSAGEIINNSFWDVHKINPEQIDFSAVFVKNIITGCTCLINQKMKIEMLKCESENMVMYDHIIALIAYGFGKAIPLKTGLILYRDHSSSVTPKLKIKISYRISNFYQNLSRKDYLIPNIVQIEEFLNKFKGYLTKENIASAERFIELKNKKILTRFLALKFPRKATKS